MTDHRTLEWAVEIIGMCEPIRCVQGGMWFGHNYNFADATFVDYGAADAFAVAAKALPGLVKEVFGTRWRPIDAAPRDGSKMLATGGGLGLSVDIVSYNERVGAWDATEYTLDDRDDEADGYSRPSHWMPLPEPRPLDAVSTQKEPS